jgi:hypothetical protein
MKKNNKLKMAIALLIIISIIVIVPATFTMYRETTKVSVSTKSGELIYDVILDSDESYLDDDKNAPYFLVTVKNNKNNFLTDVNFDYELVIKNKDGSTGLFSYINDNNVETTPVNTLTLNGSFVRALEQSKTYKVYIRSSESSESTVEYDVDYEITQKRMD